MFFYQPFTFFTASIAGMDNISVADNCSICLKNINIYKLHLSQVYFSHMAKKGKIGCYSLQVIQFQTLSESKNL